MRRLLLCLLLCLLFSLPLSLAADPFHKGWHYSGDTFTANGELYAFTMGGSAYEALLEKGSERYVITYGSCALSKDGLEKYCYTESDYVDWEKGDYDCPDDNPDCGLYDVEHVKFDAGKEKFGAYLELSDVVPVIKVGHSAEQSKLKLGERTTVTVTLENTGEDTVNAMEYVEVVPEGFDVVAALDFTAKENVLSLTTSLSPGNKKSFSYKIRPRVYTSGSFTGNLTYTYQELERQVKAGSFTINVPSPFSITHELSKEKAPIETPVTYAYTLQNNDGQYDMEASLSFAGIAPVLSGDLPDGVEEEGGRYVWEGVVEQDEEVELLFDLEAGLTGRYPINVNATMLLGGEEFSYPIQDTLVVEATKPDPEIRLSSDRIVSGNEYVLRFLLDNKEGDTPFFTIRGDLQANPADVLSLSRRLSLDHLPVGDMPIILDTTFTAPVVDSQSAVTLTATGTYQTTNGEIFSFSESKLIKILPLSETYLITHAMNATRVAPGDTVEVTVTVQNQQDAYRTVSVTDSLPSGVLVTGGFRQQELSLERDEKTEAYTSTFAVPESYDRANFTITTQVYDQQERATYSKSARLPVDLPEHLQPLEEENGTSDVPSEPEPKPRREPAEDDRGFFRKMVDGIVNFFEGLFD